MSKKLSSLHKKHKKLVDDYDTQKSKHLSKLATKMLDMDEKNSKLKNIKLSPNFLKKF